MKLIFALIGVIALASSLQLENDAYVGLDEHIEAINAAQDVWVAGPNKFSGMTHDEVRGYLGLIEHDFEERPSVENMILSTFIDVPESFDSRTKWNLLPIRDQQRCGSCWAFSSAEVLADRFSIQYGEQTVLSVQDMISCDKQNMACQGGYLDKTWSFLEETGIVSEACYPYTSGAAHVAACSSTCTGSGTWNPHKSGQYHTFSTVSAIQQEIYTNGPIQTGFRVYSDFMSYRGGVYVHTTGQLEGGHAVKILGWGNDPTVGDYWIVANSWGPGWGEQGYFRIKMEQQGLMFESSGIAGKAQK